MMRHHLVTTITALVVSFFVFVDTISSNGLLRTRRFLQFVDPRTADVKQAVKDFTTLSGSSPLCRANEPDAWKNQLLCRLDRIRTACGDLCNINDRASYEAHEIAKPTNGSFSRAASKRRWIAMPYSPLKKLMRGILRFHSLLPTNSYHTTL